MTLKKILSLSMTVVLLITAFAFGSFTTTKVNAATTFTPRLSAPSYSNAYYYSSKNIFYAAGYGMPNCTAYAFGRAYEILGTEPKLCHYNAGEWYNYNKEYGYYSYGSTPRLGAVAVWDNYDSDTGHVAVVEKISGTQVTISESAWNGTSFFTSTVSSADSHFGYSRMRFLGFIYIGDFTASDNPDDTPVPTQTPGELHRLTSTDGVNLRTGAGTGYSRILTIPYNAVIRVSTKTTAGGYTWGKVTYNGSSGWCVLDYGYRIGIIGDVNADSQVNLNDVIAIQKHISKEKPLSGNKLLLADTSGNGRVDIQDVVITQKYIGKTIDTMA